MTIEISEDDKRHSKVMKAMPAFITTALEEIHRGHNPIIFLQNCHSKIYEGTSGDCLPTTHDASSCGSKNGY